ncbi:hypothetical protein DFH09DRAFT_1375008 [Mycena vulgaris]|nr:hypothetical protein DFH09DRAFT_1375008 [Mycena vulgaris]
MSSNSTFPILTPDTPLAFLDRTTGLLYEASSYLYIASLSAYSWDLLSSIPEEVKIIRDAKFALPICVYFLSRIATFGFLLASTVFQVANVGNCQAVQVALGCCFAVAVPATASLFVFRIAAVFNANKPIVLFFIIAWLVTLGASILVPFAITGAHIASTSRCISVEVKPFAAAGTIANAVTDTLIFIALSWRLTLNGMSPGLSGRSRSFIRGQGLPKLSKALLKSGQLYYLQLIITRYRATVGFNILTMAMFFGSMPPIIHAMFAIPNVALENAMACRVFRALRLGFISSGSDSGKTSSLALSSFVASPGRVPGDVLSTSGNRTLHDTSRIKRGTLLDIQVSKTFETDDGGHMEDSYPTKPSQAAIV